MVSQWTRRDTYGAVVAALACNVVGVLGVPFTTPDAAWFLALDLPPFYPPNWVFGVVWPILYAMLGVAAYLVYREGRARQPESGSLTAALAGDAGRFVPVDREVRVALGLFVLQLGVNVAWSPAFWGFQRPALGLAVLLVLLVLVVATIRAFQRVDRRAAALLVPYLAWVGFATILNAAIVIAN